MKNGQLERSVLYAVRTTAALHSNGKNLKAAFSMMSVLRCFKQGKSRVQLVVRQSPASKDVKAEAEEATALDNI
jgi:hypothetical protein